ncbi:polysaccharide deacetylase family protein [Arenicella sp. 4NH20-0111]|uniref:polysaccharide deacetylase family protein n=1 Tax=Arenicella sp. 4NH20-0111 TaxID=3127648 RepID=UPI003103471D
MKHTISIALLFLSTVVLLTPGHSKTIALSFDDAPRGKGPLFTGEQRSVELTKKLEQHSAKPVVFFVTTREIETGKNRERIHRYAKAGHLIANHSHSHPWAHKTDSDKYVADIKQANSLLTGFDNRRPWYRFPYLDEGRTLEQRNRLRNELDQMELMNGYVTVDNYDWYIEGKWQEAVDNDQPVNIEALGEAYIEMLLSAVQFYDQLAVDTLSRSPHHVLLLHENDLAALFIGDLIEALKAQGWKIISPDEAYTDPIANYQPTTLRTGQGRIAAMAHDKHSKDQEKSKKLRKRLSHLAIEETLIDDLLSRKNVFQEQE